ncbi:hypothetical protein ACFFGT_13295 [Mucilaginibacter angelicae]|uniref:Tetratricopeptide repeat protein n=1 Tax=Mucilaginibacter angelicae TaxID=869718 RepID=A0ABV6L6V1_9SPHI
MNIFKKLFGKKDTNIEEVPSALENVVPDQPEISGNTAPMTEEIEEAPFTQEKVAAAQPEANEYTLPAAEELKKAFDEKFSFDRSEENFEIEMYNSIKRYYSRPDLDIRFNLTDANGITYKPHEAFNAVFDKWKEIRSKWDRRGLLFSFWDETESNKIGKWQIIERYNNDRKPVEAGEYFSKNVKDDDLNDALVLVAMAKTNRLLSRLEKARKIIEYAFENVPNHPKVRVEYANILHLHGNESDKQKAHNLIDELLKEKIAASDQKTIGLLNYFCFSKAYIDSSIFAASFLHAGNADLKAWDLLAEEYYYCPVFRYEHAVKLTNTNEPMLALAKLNSLADEFPWYEQGVIAAIDIINQFRSQMNNLRFMEDELQRLNHYLSVHKQHGGDI